MGNTEFVAWQALYRVEEEDFKEDMERQRQEIAAKAGR
jgi:hypothetical protein